MGQQRYTINLSAVLMWIAVIALVWLLFGAIAGLIALGVAVLFNVAAAELMD